MEKFKKHTHTESSSQNSWPCKVREGAKKGMLKIELYLFHALDLFKRILYDNLKECCMSEGHETPLTQVTIKYQN